MDKKTYQILMASLFLIVAVLAVWEYRWIRKRLASQVVPESPPKEKLAEEIPVRYRVVPEVERKGPMSDFEKMFVEHSVEDVGGNIVDAWRKVPIEDVEAISGDLESRIRDLETEVRRNPENKKAKHKLKASKYMKMMIESGFDVNKMTPLHKKKAPQEGQTPEPQQ